MISSENRFPLFGIMRLRRRKPRRSIVSRGGRTIAAPPFPINGWGLSLYVRVLRLNPAGSLSPVASPG
jgi:hypothetical protein